MVTVTGLTDDDEFHDVDTISHLSTHQGEEYRLGRSVEVTVNDGNRAPFFEEGLKTTRSIPENSGPGTPVGEPVVATDLNNDTLTYTLEAEAGGPFEINSMGQITSGEGITLDFEDATEQRARVTATDPGGRTDAIMVEIIISNVNEPPVVSGDTDLEFQENGTAAITRYIGRDPENESLTWSVAGEDGSFFSIDSLGYITFNDPPDFEDNRGNVYELTVVATDTEANKDELGVKITVTDVDEAPIVNGQSNLTVDENDENFTESYFASDPEGIRTKHTWSLSGTDETNFHISQSGVLTFQNAPDYEKPADSGQSNKYQVAVRASDSQHTGTLDVTVAVNNVDEDGLVSLSSPYAVVGTELKATLYDPDNGITGTMWQWAGSPDRSNWADIIGATGASYTPVEDDVGNYLQATATYTDAEGSGKSTMSATETAVDGDLQTRYDANGDGRIDKEEARAAVTDYFNGFVTKEEARRIVTLYFDDFS